MARKFLYLIAFVITLVLAAGLAWSLFQTQLIRAALVPSMSYAPAPDATAPNYATPAAWIARPGLPRDPSRWTAPGFPRATHAAAAIFYVPPTTSLRRDRWNDRLDDPQADQRLALFVSSQASAFNGLGPIWAPRYRQATIGAFLTDRADAARALDFAYRDVLRAFDAFVAQAPRDLPIVLVGHSQGALHLTRLLHDRIAGTPLAHRIAAAYVVGWPISTTADLPALGLPACARASDSGCILSWQSFAEPADPGQITDLYDRSAGLTGAPRRGTPMLCVNPLTGTLGGTAPASANLGALLPDDRLDDATIVPGRIPARCTAGGLLLIGPPPDGFGRYVLPGNNYHVFDYALFWANVRADAARRVAAFAAR